MYSRENFSDFNINIQVLINYISTEKQEGETTDSFEKRILGESKKILNF